VKAEVGRKYSNAVWVNVLVDFAYVTDRSEA